MSSDKASPESDMESTSEQSVESAQALRVQERKAAGELDLGLSLIHISEPTRLSLVSRMPSSA